MVKLGSHIVAALFLASLPLAAAPVPRSAPDSDPEALAVYIVQLEEPPLARARVGTGKLALDAVESRRALDLIRDRQDAALAAIEGALGRESSRSTATPWRSTAWRSR